jgi:probable HAF family extracellular repeat protein
LILSIVGLYADSQGFGEGFLYAGGMFTSLNVPGAIYTQASGINDQGQIVGHYNTTNQGVHGYLYTDGSFTTLTTAGSSSTAAEGINNHGQVVGSYVNSSNHGDGFLYTDGVLTPFDVPDAISTSCSGINDQGQIVGSYFTQPLPTLGFVATPVDKTPPLITVAANPATLSPPNGKRVSVKVSGTITDTEAGDSGVKAGSATYVVMDEYGQIQPQGSVALVDGQYTFTVVLEASRRGNDQDGRQYMIAVSATDNLGNPGAASTVVTVPHG